MLHALEFRHSGPDLSSSMKYRGCINSYAHIRSPEFSRRVRAPSRLFVRDISKNGRPSVRGVPPCTKADILVTRCGSDRTASTREVAQGLRRWPGRSLPHLVTNMSA